MFSLPAPLARNVISSVSPRVGSVSMIAGELSPVFMCVSGYGFSRGLISVAHCGVYSSDKIGTINFVAQFYEKQRLSCVLTAVQSLGFGSTVVCYNQLRRRTFGLAGSGNIVERCRDGAVGNYKTVIDKLCQF